MKRRESVAIHSCYLLGSRVGLRKSEVNSFGGVKSELARIPSQQIKSGRSINYRLAVTSIEVEADSQFVLPEVVSESQAYADPSTVLKISV